MKNLEIVANINGLNKLAESGKQFPVRVNYAISKNLKELMRFYESYEPERKKIMDRFDDMTESEREKASAQLGELLEIDNPDVSIHKIHVNDLDSCGNMTIEEFKNLEFMIDDEEE